MGFFFFKITEVYLYIWNNLFTFCIISLSHPVTNLINKRTISLFCRCILGGWVELLHFCVKQKFAVRDKNIHAVSLIFVRKHAAKAPIVFKNTEEYCVPWHDCIYTGSRTYSTKKKTKMPPSFWQASLLLIQFDYAELKVSSVGHPWHYSVWDCSLWLSVQIVLFAFLSTW